MSVEVSRPSITYGDVRSRQLEGTFPGDPTKGVWPISWLRISRGWGGVTEADWPNEINTRSWPPEEPPNLDVKAKRRRSLIHERILTAEDCVACLQSFHPVMAAFEITDQWNNPPSGIIPMPSGEPIVGSHLVSILQYSPLAKHFLFVNSWGRQWGNEGYGILPEDFFEQYLIEAWTFSGIGKALPFATSEGVQEVLYGIRDFSRRAIHIRDVYDATADERLGWAIAVERKHQIEVDDLFVRPMYRRNGIGTGLLSSLLEISDEQKMPLSFNIPFADIEPSNLSLFAKMLASIGFSIGPSAYKSVPYQAAKGISPVELHKVAVPEKPAYLLEANRANAIAEAFERATPIGVDPYVLERPLARHASVSQSDDIKTISQTLVAHGLIDCDKDPVKLDHRYERIDVRGTPLSQAIIEDRQ